MVSKTNVVFGGWYQRTTLHLSEVHRFLLHGTSDLDLKKTKLKDFHEKLMLKSVKRIVGYLEYLEWETTSGIRVRYFEDGLYVLSKRAGDLAETKKEVLGYFNDRFSPAIGYLFSLGAPTPKILANLKEVHPFVIERVVTDPLKIKIGKEMGQVYMETKSNGIRVSKTPKNIVVDISKSKEKTLERLTEMQIFFSDFKLQLHKYLDIHRKIWEEIDKVREGEFVQGKDVGRFKARLDSYQKTIQLIKNRINQMSNYARTRAKISKDSRIDDELLDLFQYRFEDLFNTLEYVKEVWVMTLDYVNSAIRVMEGIEEEVSSNNLDSIKFLVGVGVIAGIVDYFGPASIPEVALSGVLYVAGFGVLAIVLNKVFSWYGKRKKYEVEFVERDEKI